MSCDSGDTVEDVNRALELIVGHFDSARIADRLQFGYADVLEGFTTLSYMAALHLRLKFGHTVLCQSFRNPARSLPKWHNSKDIPMTNTITNDWLDEIRRRVQEMLSQAKREKLRDEYGMQFEYSESRLSPEAENEWLDYILEFERQFEEARRITVRERIGDPPIQPLSDLPPYTVDEAVTALLDLLAAHDIAVDFLGDVEEAKAYRYLTEELLDEEMDDIRIEGMVTHFTYSTPQYDVQMWVKDFVLDVFTHEREYFLPGLAHQPLFNAQGEPVTLEQFQRMIEAVWERLPPTNRVSVKPITVRVAEDEAQVCALVAWHDEAGQTEGQVESHFRLQPSPYTGWDVVQTSLLDDLMV